MNSEMRAKELKKNLKGESGMNRTAQLQVHDGGASTGAGNREQALASEGRQQGSSSVSQDSLIRPALSSLSSEWDKLVSPLSSDFQVNSLYSNLSADEVTPKALLHAYFEIYRARYLDEKCIILYKQNKCFFHVGCAGHEAIQVAV